MNSYRKKTPTDKYEIELLLKNIILDKAEAKYSGQEGREFDAEIRQAEFKLDDKGNITIRLKTQSYTEAALSIFQELIKAHAKMSMSGNKEFIIDSAGVKLLTSEEIKPITIKDKSVTEKKSIPPTIKPKNTKYSVNLFTIYDPGNQLKKVELQFKLECLKNIRKKLKEKNNDMQVIDINKLLVDLETSHQKVEVIYDQVKKKVEHLSLRVQFFKECLDILDGKPLNMGLKLS